MNNKLKHSAKRVLLILCTVSIISATAQTAPMIKDLKVGDQCPDLVFKNFYNRPGETKHLSDYKGKWVIIDFWATWCSGCIGTFPDLEKMQEKYPDKLQIFTVTYEDSLKLAKPFRENKILKNIQLPMIYKDSVLQKYFVHRSVPHTIIIDEKGVVKEITFSSYLTMDIMDKLINHKAVDIVPKIENLKFDLNQPLLLGGMGNESPIDPQLVLYSSLLTQGIPGALYFQSPAQIQGRGYSCIKASGPILRLYQTAFALKVIKRGHPELNPDFLMGNQYSRIIWEARDSIFFTGIGYNAKRWIQLPNEQKAFYYELLAPEKDSVNLSKWMLQDLNDKLGRLYGIEGLREKRKVKCWAFVRSNAPVSQDTMKEAWELNQDIHKMEVGSNTVNEFLFWWTIKHQTYNPIPIIDETNYTGKFSFNIDAGPDDDIETLAEKLKPFGFTFKLVERDIDMIVIRDKK